MHHSELNCAINRLQAALIAAKNALLVTKMSNGSFCLATVENCLQATAAYKTVSPSELNGLCPTLALVFEGHSDIGAAICCTLDSVCKLDEAIAFIPPILDDVAMIVGVAAPVVDKENTKAIINAFNENNACIIAERGSRRVLCVGANPFRAVSALMVMDKSATILECIACIGGAAPLDRNTALWVNKDYREGYSKRNETAVHMQSEDIKRDLPLEELELRQRLILTAQSLIDSNLMQGTWGNLSCRLDDEHMLCTPSGIDYHSVTPYDIVRVNIFTLEHEGWQQPTSEKLFHARLYAAHGDINCVIHTHPTLCGVFASAKKPLPIRGREALSLFWGDAALSKYAASGTAELAKNVVDCFETGRACIMANHGVVVGAESLEKAFRMCQLMEQEAFDRIAEARAEGQKG